MPKPSRAEADIERRISEFADDPQRVDVLRRAALFKRGWMELGEALANVRDGDLHESWGYSAFAQYCGSELHLRRGTADKLTASYGYLRANAPEVLHRAGVGEPIPTPETVSTLARVAAKEQVPRDVFEMIQADALAADVSPASLAKQFKDAIAPASPDQEERQQVQAAAKLARRLARLLPDLERRLPSAMVADVEDQLGNLIRHLEQLDEGEA